jgi:hypothetical protein
LAKSRRLDYGVDRLLELLNKGADLDDACVQVCAEMALLGPDTGLFRVKWVSMSVPSFASVPSARCMADKLRGIAAPTREIVEAAINACSKSSSG